MEGIIAINEKIVADKKHPPSQQNMRPIAQHKTSQTPHNNHIGAVKTHGRQ